MAGGVFCGSSIGLITRFKEVSLRLKVGSRLRSAVDDTAVIVIRAPQEELDVTCGGHPLVPLDAELAGHAAPTDGRDGGTQLGKRYIDKDSRIELLCTRAGAGALFLGDVPLSVKSVKPLPASD